MSSRTCSCGHDVNHKLVLPEPVYSFWGHLLLILGATPTPLRAVFRCERCRQILGRTTDPQVLKEFV
jgi:hypothetical protein